MNMRASACTLFTFVGLLAPAVAPARAFAQNTAPPAVAAPASPGSGTRAAGTPARVRAVEERQERRIAELRRQLKITQAQEAQWNAFTAVMRDNMTHMRAVYADNVATGQGTALDDMRAYAAITSAHAEDVQKLVPAFTTLYAAMSPEQRKTADDVFHQYARRQAQGAPARE